MKIVLATGIYPPAIGGPATYCRALAHELRAKGISVCVVTYASNGKLEIANGKWSKDPWPVVSVVKWGGPIFRWWRYARALRRHAADADAIVAFSSVSTGIPLAFARLKVPKKILRLGGDFFWERYTDRGGMMNLREWYDLRSLVSGFWILVSARILRAFDHVAFSTRHEEEIYERHYKNLLQHSVIENAFPVHQSMTQSMRLVRTGEMRGDTLRLLFMGRFVGFKNVPALLRAISVAGVHEPQLRSKVTITLVGDGPMRGTLAALVRELGIADRVKFLLPVHGAEKQRIFAEHDLLVIPSLTELSPNVALEARAAGLPVLLTKETGLSQQLTHGMFLRELRAPEQILAALSEVEEKYAELVESAMQELPSRSYGDIAEEFLQLISQPPLRSGGSRTSATVDV